MISLIFLLGLVLRLILSNQSFWLDEGASLMFAKMSLPHMLEAIKADFHPPLFYILLKYWLPLAGSSEWLIRLPFIAIGALTVPAVYFLCQTILGKKSLVPIVSAFFLAINPLHIYYSQELRMYSLATLFVALSWYALVKKRYVILAILNLLCLFTFYGTVLNIISEIIYLSISKSWNKKYLLGFLSSGVLFAPWITTFLTQLDNGSYLRNALPGWQLLSGPLTLKSLLLIPIKFIMGRIALEPQKLYFAVGVLMVSLFSSLIFVSKKLKGLLSMQIAFFVPIFLGSIISLKTPMLGYWRFLFVLPFFLILTAAGIDQLPHKISKYIFIFICFCSIFFNVYFWKSLKFQREDWRGLTQFLSSSNSLVVISFPQAFAPLHHYATNTAVLPALDENYKIKKDILQSIADEMQGHSTIMVMDYLADLTDSNREVLKLVQNTELKQVAIYNFNNLGQVYEFKKQ